MSPVGAGFAGKSVLVTGGTGMIGRPLVARLLDLGARVRVVSLDDVSRADPRAEFRRADLTYLDECLRACEGMDWVFQLAGIKGSPAMTARKPASFFFPTLSFSLNVMEAARRAGVRGYLYTSSIGVYPPAEVFREDDAWSAPPSPNDRFAGWAKRMGELQAEAYRIEHGWEAVSIVRPANVYGPFDSFDPVSAMVVPSLIRRALSGEDPLVVWGDGSQVRDFIHADDVAEGMLRVAESGSPLPVNLGSGTGASIRDLVGAVLDGLEALGRKRPEVVWDTAKPSGDRTRVMDVSRARALGFQPSVALPRGVADTMRWYAENTGRAELRFNAFL